jgi:hypothetical protein
MAENLVPVSTDTTFEYIPVAEAITPGNSAPHNPFTDNPLRDPVSKPLSTSR